MTIIGTLLSFLGGGPQLLKIGSKILISNKSTISLILGAVAVKFMQDFTMPTYQ